MKNEPEELEQQQGWGWGEGGVRMEESASFGAEYKVFAPSALIILTSLTSWMNVASDLGPVSPICKDDSMFKSTRLRLYFSGLTFVRLLDFSVSSLVKWG